MYRAIKDEARAHQRFQQACDFSIRHEIANTAYFRASDTAATGAAPAFCSQATGQFSSLKLSVIFVL